MIVEAIKQIVKPQTVLDFVLPPRCPMCRNRIWEHGHLCSQCWASLTPIADPKCVCCALPFAFAVDALVCGACLERPPPYDQASAPVLYDERGRDLVLALKHGGLFAAVPVMARMMTAALPQSAQFDCVMPVPLHRWRLLKRRFNQSQLLATDVAKLAALPLDVQTLRRFKATPSQGTLGRAKRFVNVSNAFKLRDDRSIAGKRILLIDDVLTTGATIGACAAVLKEAGASYVHAAVFARVGQPLSG